MLRNSPVRDSVHHRKRPSSSPTSLGQGSTRATPVLPLSSAPTTLSHESLHRSSDSHPFLRSGGPSRVWRRGQIRRLVPSLLRAGRFGCLGVLMGCVLWRGTGLPRPQEPPIVGLHDLVGSDMGLRLTNQWTPATISIPRPMAEDAVIRSTRPNYGGIRYGRRQPAPAEQNAPGPPAPRRSIAANDNRRYQVYRTNLLETMDTPLSASSDQERAILSDPTRYEHWDDVAAAWHTQSCRRPKWSYDTNLNCNTLHETMLSQLDAPSTLEQFAVKYLSQGSFRMAWLLQERALPDKTQRIAAGTRITHTDHSIVMKNLRYALDITPLTMKQVHLEALVMSQTLNSRVTADIYGHCGTSILVETGQSIRNAVFYTQTNMPQAKVLQEQGRYNRTSLNELTDEQRLKMAVSMAESLAAMHGNPKGVIVNNDLQVFQWVVCRDGNIKLNDFNNAVIMEWDDKKQEYCKFIGSFDSVYRSPQENKEEPTDESADVHVLGSMYYNLLTGLMPFYHKENSEDSVQALVEKKELPFIDPAFRNGTMVQRTLVRIIEDCLQYEPDDRPSVFQVLQRLRDTVTVYERSHINTRIASIDLRPLGRPL